MATNYYDLDAFIVNLQKVREEHGNLPIWMENYEDGQNDPYPLLPIRVEEQLVHKVTHEIVLPKRVLL